MNVTRTSPGVYRVEIDGRQEIVYVASNGAERWAFWNGRVFRVDANAAEDSGAPARPARRDVTQSLTAPMPATVVKVLVEPGTRIKNGETVLLLEAMKMELPLRAPRDAVVKAVNCRAGELVQPDKVLVELEG